MKLRMRKCPFCKGLARLVVCDEEGNVHGDDYENDPWSGLCFGISHTESDDPTGACPIATNEGYIGGWHYDTRKEATDAWNGKISPTA